MGPDIDERPAALLVFIQENTPVGCASATDRICFGIINIAQIAPIDHALQIRALGLMPVLVTDRELHACFFCGFYHAPGISGCLGHRLLAHYMLARIQRINCNFSMGTVRGAHMYRIDSFVAEQLLVVCIYLCVGCAIFGSGFFCFFLDDIAESHHVCPVDCLQGRHMFPVSDSAAADDSDTQPICH